ncbi:response regulator transcription factor [Saccharopolyspora gregorii]|uniref:KyaR n=2 Tax=Saccharopolyspora TaxID=1835 RepID=A0A4Y6I2A3_9PSEU|nr:response regulator transcription factor [Saccharopolyspora gregorii]QDF63356.1 KyaR [Saccharopolyspora sp.]
MIRTLIVDDDTLVRLALADILADAPGITVVGQAGDGLSAVREAAAGQVDVVLMDVRMPELDGIQATERLRALPNPPQVVTLTTFDLDEYVYGSLTAGAAGFLLKDSEPAEIVRAVQVVASGQAMLHPAAARRLVDHYHRGSGPDSAAARAKIERLTPRERDVLGRLATGDGNAEIASALGMRESTVKAHVSRILAALDVGNRVQAALCAWAADQSG